MPMRHDKSESQVEAMRRRESQRLRNERYVERKGPAGPSPVPEASPMPDEMTTQFVSEDVIRELYDQAHAAELAEQQRFLDWLGAGGDCSMFD